MSEFTKKSLLSGLELTISNQSNPVIPNWLGESILLGKYWIESGLLERLQQQVRVSRGRMGDYEVCDFVLLLLIFATIRIGYLVHLCNQIDYGNHIYDWLEL